MLVVGVKLFLVQLIFSFDEVFYDWVVVGDGCKYDVLMNDVLLCEIVIYVNGVGVYKCWIIDGEGYIIDFVMCVYIVGFFVYFWIFCNELIYLLLMYKNDFEVEMC